MPKLKAMTCRQMRTLFLKFYESKGHTIYPSGSLIPIDVTGKLDESLLFNGAGMIQFKPYFRGLAEPENRRLTTAQKCVRTGDIEEVGDDSHLTFFEMLGNFSFGDYFKQEAIDYSWEFLTSPEWLGLDPRRLSFTIFETDDEAYGYWAEHLKLAGIDPSTRIIRLGEETNYWPAGAFTQGPPGPCGPNSEMFYWTNPDLEPPGILPGEYDRERWLADDEARNWLEIGNDVFIQYEWQGELKNPSRPSEGYAKTGMPNLPFNSIDTGSGLERAVAIISGFKSVYDTDAFTPIFGKISELRGGQPAGNESETRAYRIIADHIRTAAFCIADAILPANNGRGYVLRRLIRRAVLKGQRILGFDEPFMHKVVDSVIETFGDHYSELADRQSIIRETLLSEEELFRRTLKRGSELLSEELGRTKAMLSGEIAFKLYDTFGFPLEVTKELCAEAGVSVDEAGFEAAMGLAQERSRGAQGETAAYGGLIHSYEIRPGQTQTHDPHGALSLVTEIIGAASLSGQERVEIALRENPFYATSGGQLHDVGTLSLSDEEIEFEVVSVAKHNDLVWCVTSMSIDEFQARFPKAASSIPEENAQFPVFGRIIGKAVRATVRQAVRDDIRRNHTATHLLHAALREALGTGVTQAGSYVGPDSLRFDFTYGKAIEKDQLRMIERRVNEEILRGTTVTTYVDLPIDEAKARGAMALFGEKYGDKVRMVEIGEFSRELCGGTHVRNTGEIGLIKIVSEGSAASGVRRIEAVTGLGAYQLATEEMDRLREIAGLLKCAPKEAAAAVQRTLDQLKEERKKRERAEMVAIAGAGTSAPTPAATIGPFTLWVKNFGEADPKVASQAIDTAANQKPDQVTLGAVTQDGKIQFICKVGPGAVANGAHAGNLLREVAKIAGGGGGGKADFATAGGRDASKIDEALSAAAGFLASSLG